MPLSNVGGSAAFAQEESDNNITVNFPDTMNVSGDVDINYNPGEISTVDMNSSGSGNDFSSTATKRDSIDSSDLTYLSWTGSTNNSSNGRGSLGTFTYNFASWFGVAGGDVPNASATSADLTFTISPSLSLPSFNLDKLKTDFSTAIFGKEDVAVTDLLFGLSQKGTGARTDYSYNLSLPWINQTWTFKIPFSSFHREFNAFYQFIWWFCPFLYWSSLLYSIIYTVVKFP